MSLTLHDWAVRWNIPLAALQELCNLAPEPVPEHDGHSEAWAQTEVRLEASELGGRLWRNNVGVLKNEKGVPVRYGLANDSAQLNKVCKSSDLVGVMPVLITPEMVGTVIGRFTCREVKVPSWSYTGQGREPAQLEYMRVVNALGGDAKFATGRGTF